MANPIIPKTHHKQTKTRQLQIFYLRQYFVIMNIIDNLICFEDDLLKKSVFEYAKYIKAAESASAFSLYAPAPIFRRTFSVKQPKKARIFVQSPGFARYYINGRFKQIDEYEQLIILTDGKKIPIQEVHTIGSDLFRGMFD